MNPIFEIQGAAWRYGWDKADARNGLVPDHIDKDGIIVSPASIAVTGMMLTALPVAVENGWVTRMEAAHRALKTLRFFARDAEQYGGFFFHFLDLESGARVWDCEVSSIDSTFVFLGGLFCAAYFDGKSGVESEVRDLAAEIFERADWGWFRGDGDAVSLSYTPEKGLSKHQWVGWNEALPLKILALGSPTHPLPPETYAAWTKTYRFKRLYGRDFLYCGPLFTHLFPHLWLDLRGQFDAPMRKAGFDYFENTRRAVQIQSDWAKRRGEARKWGVSACDAPQSLKLGGYRARGVPWGCFDEVYSPPVVLASLPFAPDLALESWNDWRENFPELVGEWGVRGAVEAPTGWLADYFGLDQAMLVLMLENWRSGLLWDLSHRIPALQLGLDRAGFSAEEQRSGGVGANEMKTLLRKTHSPPLLRWLSRSRLLLQQGDDLGVLLQKLLVLLDHDLVLRGLQYLEAQIGFGDGLSGLFGGLSAVSHLVIAGQKLADGGAREF